MKYVRENIENTYGILDLQDKILEIMIDVDKFCCEYNIDYCLMAGSALGARRHAGFIPWDDDIDIYMTEKDYLKFRNIFDKDGNKEKYYLQEWGKTDLQGNHMITMAKIRMNGTEIHEKSFVGWKIHQGVFVDIFILHNCPDDMKLQKRQYIWSEAVVLKGLETKGYKAKGYKDRIMLSISRVIPRRWLLREGLKNTYKYQDIKTKYTHGFIDTRKFYHAVFPRDIMFPGKYVDFETVKLKVPANNDEYLRIQFGEDYMLLPPIEKRKVHKHADGWREGSDIEYHDFSDEYKLI
jgi:lipopolysaccharide cholinephosphotransferase